THKAKTFENTASGHKAIIQLLSKLKGGSRVCMEATGVYHFDLALALSGAEGMDVMVINPKALHNFANIQTDAVDAEILAIYCETMPFEAWQRPVDEIIALRAMARTIAALTKLKTQTKNQLHALKATEETPVLVIEYTEEL
ncbi:MAG: IS110 family transposase, partial [Methylobacter sp.]